MRRIIIDTDTGSDDAIALIMALKSPEINIEAITTLSGNCELNQATKNALMTIEITNSVFPPVYKGTRVPLFRALETATHVHGLDGMGDLDLIHPTIKETKGSAVDKIIELVKKYPNEIEIITIGPATNIAQAILKDKETMQLVKKIYAMGTAGLGAGNITPVAEFNVYVDAEAFKIMIESGIDIIVIGYDICVEEASFRDKEFDILLNSGIATAVYSVQINKVLLEWNISLFNDRFINLPDPMAMAVLLWEDTILESKK